MNNLTVEKVMAVHDVCNCGTAIARQALKDNKGDVDEAIWSLRAGIFHYNRLKSVVAEDFDVMPEGLNRKEKKAFLSGENNE